MDIKMMKTRITMMKKLTTEHREDSKIISNKGTGESKTITMSKALEIQTEKGAAVQMAVTRKMEIIGSSVKRSKK